MITMMFKYWGLFYKYKNVLPEVGQLVDVAVKAVEDGKISKKEQSALMKEYWDVINKIKESK